MWWGPFRRGSASSVSCWDRGVVGTLFQTWNWRAGWYGELITLAGWWKTENGHLCPLLKTGVHSDFPGYIRSRPAWGATAPYVRNVHWINRRIRPEAYLQCFFGNSESRFLIWQCRDRIAEGQSQQKEWGGEPKGHRTQNDGGACRLWLRTWTLHCSDDLEQFAHFLRIPISPCIKVRWWYPAAKSHGDKMRW